MKKRKVNLNIYELLKISVTIILIYFPKLSNYLRKQELLEKIIRNLIHLSPIFEKASFKKFFIVSKREPQEIDFISTAKLLEAHSDTKREKLGQDFYELLEKNKKAFELVTIEDIPELKMRGGRDAATQMLKILKALKDLRKFTEDQEIYLRKVIREVEEGGLPKQTTKNTLKELQKELKNGLNPLKILGVLQKNIPSDLLKEHIVESAAQTSGPREVILSEYLVSA